MLVLQDGQTALITASRDDHTAVVQALLADPRVEVNMKSKVRSICCVCAWGYVSCIFSFSAGLS